MRKGDVLAIFCSDIHLSDRPPIARSAETDWFGAMACPLLEVDVLSRKWDVPVVIAGDIFDKATPSIELVNFAILNLPRCYAVPGQHDLLHHSYENIRKTAYQTLVEADVIINLSPKRSEMCGSVAFHGFPWNMPLTPLKQKDTKTIDVAVIHHFCWAVEKRDSHPGASESSNAKVLAKRLDGFDIAVFGDNHKPFSVPQNQWYPQVTWPTIFNCGGLMRRTIKEINHKPRVGLLMSTGEIVSHELDCSKDKFADIDEVNDVVDAALDLTGMVHDLRELRDKGLNFLDALKRFCNDNEIGKSIVTQILKAVK